MKKLLVVLLTLSLLLGSFLSLAVSADTSPVKDYKTAQDGELLYTLNFNGDSAYTPSVRGEKSDRTYTPSADGLSLTIQGVAGTGDSGNFYGGIVKGLMTDTVNATYSMKYTVNASANPIKNNSTGIGGLILVEGNADTNPYFYNNYSNHNQAGSDSRSAITITKDKQGDYVMWNTLAKAPKMSADGAVTMLNVFDLSQDKMITYFLAEDDSWFMLEDFKFGLFDTDADIEPEYGIGFMTNAFYEVVNTTISNVGYYKGNLAEPKPNTDNGGGTGDTGDTGNTGGDTGNTGDNNTGNTDNTDTTTTKAPETTTKAPETTVAAEKRGCGSSIGFAGLALVAAVATVGVAKKRKND